MSFHDLALLSRRDRVRLAVLVIALIAVSIWASIQFLQPGPPRRIVLASGAESGLYHRYARQYVEALGRERMAVGSAGSGTRALAEQMLKANGLMMDNGVTRGNTEAVAIGRNDALRALKAGEVDAAFFVGGAPTPMERDVATRKEALPFEKWLQSLDRIQQAVEHLKTPTMYPSEAYTLREHIVLVRRAVLAKGGESVAAAD